MNTTRPHLIGNKHRLDKIPWNKGLIGVQVVSDKTREKLSKVRIGNQNAKGKKHRYKRDSSNSSGEKHYNWKGGISCEPYSKGWTDLLRESIRQRDGYICQKCGIHQDKLSGFHKKIDIHHIDSDKNNLNPKNLTTLCRKCHTRLHRKIS